jgi:mevalonate kinase
MSESPFFVSAPGKVIIFGEHSAVYGKSAIAAALSLRAYLLVSPSEDANTITLDFPDIGLSHSWNKQDLLWDDIKKHVKVVDGLPCVTEELIPEITDKLSDALADVESSLHYTACHCFLYLYTQLCDVSIPGMKFCVRSTLPIGAGLGSSASTAVCLSSALAVLGGHISRATYNLNDKLKNKEDPEAAFIDSWSLMGEKCFHGNPSGIDNAVATHGGAVMFQKKDNPDHPSVRISMRNFPPFKLLLTNTKIPRSTAVLVGGVARIKSEYPKMVNSILDAMGHLAVDAYQLMMRPVFDKKARETLGELVNINHGLLVALGVSHPALEKIKIIGDTHDIGATKLTGAGGGGCAITLVKDDVEESVIQQAITEFEANEFECFETSLGGKGVGSLSISDVEEDKAVVFDYDGFANFKDRHEIENALGVQNVNGWKFWG